MMFSSNQVLEVSGSLSHSNELETALKFALKYSGYEKNMSKSEIERGCKLVYQITESGKYCIGWGFEDVPRGWLEYPFRFDIDIVSQIIRQYLEEYSIKENIWDGAYAKGFIMKCCPYVCEDIKNSAYCIVYFEHFTCFYAK